MAVTEADEILIALFGGKDRTRNDADFSIAFDAGRHHQTEQALRESEERYRDLYDEAPIAYFSIGIDSRIRQANKRAVELLGYPMPELLGRSVFDFIADTPLRKPKAQKLFQKLVAGEEVRSEELELRNAGGEQVWVLLSFKPILDARGKVVADRSMLEDITARKRLEQALQQYSENCKSSSMSARLSFAAPRNGNAPCSKSITPSSPTSTATPYLRPSPKPCAPFSPLIASASPSMIPSMIS